MLKKLLILGCGLGLSVSSFAQQNIAQQDTLQQHYLKLAKSAKPEDKQEVQQAIDKYSKDNSEDDLSFAVRLANANKQSALADSLNKIAIVRYPKGKSARVDEYNKIVITHGTAADKQAMYEAWIKKFPEPADNTDIVYDYARSEVAMNYAENKDLKNNLLWTGKIKNSSYKGTVQNASGKIFLAKGDTISAESLMRNGVASAKKNLAGNANPMAKNDYIMDLSGYASLLYSEKKYKEALNYITQANEVSGGKIAETSDLYLLILTENGRGKEALPKLTELIKSGKNSPDDERALKLAYIQDKGSDAGYEAFHASVMQEMRESIRAKLAKEMLDQPAPEFTLVDLDGKKVSLGELKGKVVVLDFWATWCGPCKRSFPAMQMAVNKYKSDPNVKFLFIDTWERIPDASKNVQAFISEQKYNFRVLLDDKTTKVVDKFGISGIPSKFIIGPDGKIRFRLMGFDGSNEAAVEELSYMIEAAKTTD